MESEKSPAEHCEEPGTTWIENAGLIKAFLEQRPKYERLCSEVAYILKKRLDERQIAYAAVSSRAKLLESFLEKLGRKSYENPFKQNTDFAGARVVFLYVHDRAAIEEIVTSEFEVVNRIDRENEYGTDRFGYTDLQFLVQLGPKSSGARYDDLKNLICEIQIRTVMQDAWAIISHQLVYKDEASVPKELQRDVNALAGALKTVDGLVDRLQAERKSYIATIRSKQHNRDDFLDQDLNLDSLVEYLQWRFPKMRPATIPDFLNGFLEDANRFGYRKLRDVHDLLLRTDEALGELNKSTSTYARNIGISILLAALALDEPKARYPGRWGEMTSEFKKYEHLVKKKQ